MISRVTTSGGPLLLLAASVVVLLAPTAADGGPKCICTAMSCFYLGKEYCPTKMKGCSQRMGAFACVDKDVKVCSRTAKCSYEDKSCSELKLAYCAPSKCRGRRANRCCCKPEPASNLRTYRVNKGPLVSPYQGYCWKCWNGKGCYCNRKKTCWEENEAYCRCPRDMNCPYNNCCCKGSTMKKASPDVIRTKCSKRGSCNDNDDDDMYALPGSAGKRCPPWRTCTAKGAATGPPKCKEFMNHYKAPEEAAPVDDAEACVWYSWNQVRPGNQPLPQAPSSVHIRKEVREMSDDEWNDFVKASKLLIEDTQLYKGFTDWFNGANCTCCRNSIASIAYNRIFVEKMERALQSKVPGCILPFYDSSLDQYTDGVPAVTKLFDVFDGIPTKIAKIGTLSSDYLQDPVRAKYLRYGEGDEEKLKEFMTYKDLACGGGPSCKTSCKASDGCYFEQTTVSQQELFGGTTMTYPTADPRGWMIMCFMDSLYEQVRKKSDNPEVDYVNDIYEEGCNFNDDMSATGMKVYEALSDSFSKYIQYQPYVNSKPCKDDDNCPDFTKCDMIRYKCVSDVA